MLQINTATAAALNPTGVFSAFPSASTHTVDSDFYWLPNVPADPPGIGTTQQWIYQPCNPPIASAASQLVQLPRLGGYLSTIILDLRDAAGLRVTENGTTNQGWPSRPKLLIDGVPLVDSLFGTLAEEIAIVTGVGCLQSSAASSATGVTSGVADVPRPLGTMAISYKGSMSQRSLGLLDTGETYPSTNPGTQIEVAGFPWGTVVSGPMQLNAVCGQIVPSGALVRGLPEA